MSGEAQNYKNHAKMVPGYHYVLAAVLLALIVTTVAELVRNFGWPSIVGVLWVVALTLTAFYARVFALAVQDRVIRLEERLRMAEILPDDLRGRIGEITTEQLIGLRFASDEELPGLVRRVLDEGIADRKTIKQAVTHWRADHQRT
jgi:hypothetical protein